MTTTPDSKQLPLLPRSELARLPIDSGHYVAAVQNKAGELGALRRASAATWQRLTPLIHLVGPLEKRLQPYPAATVRAWLARVAEAVSEHPVYLDVMRLDPLFPVRTVRGSVPVLSQIYEAARGRGISFVPVAWVGESSRSHIEMVSDAVLEDGQGAALRYRFLRSAVPAGKTRAEILIDLLTRLTVDVSRSDLLLDLEYLDPDDILDAQAIARSIAEMEAVGPWRSVVILGSTIPKMLTCIEEGTVGSLERREWNLWTELGRCSLSRLPAFGDYVVQHPRPPSGGGPGMRANIRYTTAAATLVARGEGSVLEEGSEQYRDLCKQLVSRTEYSGQAYSWGDGVIYDCATGAIEPGSQSLWRGAGTSHHLRFVTDQIRRRRAAAA